MIKKITKNLKNLIFRFRDDDVTALASQLAYSFIFSFFPFLIFLITLVGYSSISSQDVLVGLNKIIPANILDLVKKTIEEVVDNQNGNLMSFSLIFTIWSASGGFSAVIRGLNKAYGETECRSIFKLQLISIICTFGVTIIILVTIFFLIFGQIIGNFLIFKLEGVYLSRYVLNAMRYVVIVLSTAFIFAVIYHYTPCKRLRWKEVIPGAIFSTMALIVISIGFAFYVNNFGNYSRVYGSIGAVIILLTWLFMVSVVIIMGGELNAVLSQVEKEIYN